MRAETLRRNNVAFFVRDCCGSRKLRILLCAAKNNAPASILTSVLAIPSTRIASIAPSADEQCLIACLDGVMTTFISESSSSMYLIFCLVFLARSAYFDFTNRLFPPSKHVTKHYASSDRAIEERRNGGMERCLPHLSLTSLFHGGGGAIYILRLLTLSYFFPTGWNNRVWA